MCMHCLNNAVALLLGLYGDKLVDVLPIFFKEDLGGLEIIILVVLGAVLISVSTFWMKAIARKRDMAIIDVEMTNAE